MSISPTLQTAMFGQNTDDGLVELITISSPELAIDIRVVNDKADMDSRGDTFTRSAFNLILPSDDPDSPSNAQVTIDNTTREIGQAIRQMQGAATVLIETVKFSDPDTVELSFPLLTLRNVRWDVGKATGDILSDDLVTEGYPGHTFNPSTSPGAF